MKRGVPRRINDEEWIGPIEDRFRLFISGYISLEEFLDLELTFVVDDQRSCEDKQTWWLHVETKERLLWSIIHSEQ